jgi:PAS domain-containing protein
METDLLEQPTPERKSLTELVEVLAGQPAESVYDINLRSAWNAVKQNNLVICSDVFDKIDKEDIIEIWDLEGHQLFRSFHALRYFSYTIEELTSYPFYELFERDLEVEAAYATEFVRVIKGEVSGTYKLEIPPHVVREKLSVRRNVSMVTPKYVSPLKDKYGRLVAFIYTCSARRLDD